MHDPIAQELSELLGLVFDIKTHLRELEDKHEDELLGDDVLTASLPRVRHHLELILDAVTRSTRGEADAAVPKLTGEAASGEDAQADDGRPQVAPERGSGVPKHTGVPPQHSVLPPEVADVLAHRVAPGPSAADRAAPSPGSAPTPNGPDGKPSVWVKNRVDEIHRALSAAFGDDDVFAEPSDTPQPFATPEFVGNTDTLAVPELIGFFQLQSKTGVLTIDARHEQFSLEYLNGELIHARSTSSPRGERLGEILVELGHITESKLQRLLAGKTTAERIGDALRRGDIIDEAKIAQALDVQVQRIFHRMFGLQGCRFTFREGLEGEPRARVRYNITRLLLETARHHDEQNGRDDDERAAG